MSVDPLTAVTLTVGKDPWVANQAIPTLLVGRFRPALAQIVPGLILENVERNSFVSYPLSGGFQSWCLLPEILVPGRCLNSNGLPKVFWAAWPRSPTLSIAKASLHFKL